MKAAITFACLLLALSTAAQSKPAQKSKTDAKPAGPQPVAASTGVYYPLPAEIAAQLRALQHKNDLLEMDNQRMQVKIEQNRQLQQQLTFQEQGLAFQYASEKHIDLSSFQLDMQGDDVRFDPIPTAKKAQ